MWCYVLAEINKVEKLFSTLFFKDIIGRNRINLQNKPVFKQILIYPPWYLLQIVSAVLDLFFVGEILSWISRVLNRNVRMLSNTEVENLTSLSPVYIALGNIYIVEESWLAKIGMKFTKSPQLGVCVANTIHFSRVIDEKDITWLLHECIHKLQFKQRGIIYIFEALIAQRFSGYNYKLPNWREYSLKTFNPEQQAEILSKERAEYKKVDL